MPDREKVINIYENCILNDKQCCSGCYTGGPGLGIACRQQVLADALYLLKEQEAHKFFVDESGKITPLPVVVRCKDCVFGKREKNDSTGMTWIYCGHHRENRPEDWFCASGSRI